MGDGGFLFCMEKRGYVKAGQWTPEVTVEHPEAGKEILFLVFNFKIELEFSNHIQFDLFLKLPCYCNCERQFVYTALHFQFNNILSTEL